MKQRYPKRRTMAQEVADQVAREDAVRRKSHPNIEVASNIRELMELIPIGLRKSLERAQARVGGGTILASP